MFSLLIFSWTVIVDLWRRLRVTGPQRINFPPSFPQKSLVHCTNMIICVCGSLLKSAQTQFIIVVVFVNFYSASTDKTTDLYPLAAVGGVWQRTLPGTWFSS